MRVKKSHLALMAAAVSGAFTVAAEAAVAVSSAGAATGQALIARETLPSTTAVVFNGSNALDVTFPLGFGASAGQDRYVRVDLNSGATFSGAPSFSPGASASNVTLVAGGAAASYAVWQVTAGASGMAGTATMTLAPSAVSVASTLATQNSGVTFSISNHETANSASNGTGTQAQGGALLSQIATGQRLFSVGSALNVTSGAAATSTLQATTNFTSFCTSATNCAATPGSTYAALGTVSVGLASGTIYTAASSSALTQVTTMDQVVSTSTYITVSPNVSVGANGTAGPSLGFSGSTNCGMVAFGATMSSANVATLAIGTNTLTNQYLCFNLNSGSTTSLSDNITFSGSYFPAAVGTTTIISASTAGITAGGWVREGVSLQAPWVAFAQGGTITSRIFVTNTGAGTVSCFGRVSNDGTNAAPTLGAATFTIPAAANNAPGIVEVPVNATSTTSAVAPLVSATATGSYPRGSVVITCVAPADKIQATMVATNTSNGTAVNTPLLRPNTN